MIYLTEESRKIQKVIFDITHIFFPEQTWNDMHVFAEGRKVLAASYDDDSYFVSCGGTEAHGAGCGDRNRAKKKLRNSLYAILAAEYPEKKSAWGTLTGIRPSKVVHRMLDSGMGRAEILNELETEYHLYPVKAEKLLDISLYQRERFPLSFSRGKEEVSLYFSIPFCPGKCSYCSFPSFPLHMHRKMVAPYLEALHRETAAVYGMLRENGLGVRDIYVGGGTPGILTAGETEKFMSDITSLFAPGGEITFEAGRADCITARKLGILKKNGVSRICINPQTFDEATLKRVGRSHTNIQVEESFAMARAEGFRTINMDFIAGLPGESRDTMLKTIRRAVGMGPENITVHSLARKRFSALGKTVSPSEMGSSPFAIEMFDDILTAAGYRPYYLYRQKDTAGGQENLGYALEGTACAYNVDMIEERRTIVSLGSGASSKLVNPDDFTLLNLFNPKDIYYYVKDIEKIITKKRKEHEEHFRKLAEVNHENIKTKRDK